MNGKSIELTLKDAIDVYLRQRTAEYQLWAMYAVASFTGGTFAIVGLNSDLGNVKPYILGAGALGFLIFTLGHTRMVESVLQIANAAVEDIGRLSDGLAVPAYLRNAAARIDHAKWVHRGIDFCVLLCFGCAILAAALPSGR